jgi:hypothetical protein
MIRLSGIAAPGSAVLALAQEIKKAPTSRPSCEFGSPGPLGAALPQRSVVDDPSDQYTLIEASEQIRPACLNWHRQ